MIELFGFHEVFSTKLFQRRNYTTKLTKRMVGQPHHTFILQMSPPVAEQTTVVVHWKALESGSSFGGKTQVRCENKRHSKKTLS
ncbi:MAG: hypothetical protein ABGX03_08090 [Methylophilaceae bacterium]